MNNLASILKAKGLMNGAEELYRQVVSGREQILGESHLHTLNSVHNLAICLQSKHVMYTNNNLNYNGNNNNEIIQDSRSMHEIESENGNSNNNSNNNHIYSKELKNKMNNIVDSVNHLNNKLQSYADLKEVEVLLQRVLTGRVKILGNQHMDTCEAAYSFGEFLETKNDWGGASITFELAYNGYVILLGVDNEETLNCLYKWNQCKEKC